MSENWEKKIEIALRKYKFPKDEAKTIFCNIIKDCLKFNENERPTAEIILENLLSI